MHYITKSHLDRANLTVTGELDAMGFYDERVHRVDVYRAPVGYAYGWHYYGSSGEINIPAVSLSRLYNLFEGTYTSLRDILRHEYAHAVADTHRGLIRSRRFADAFGAHHTWDFGWEYDDYYHVTSYAATAPAEDFAEVFMLYLKHGGRMPSRFAHTAVSKKWSFVKDLRGAVSCGRRRW